MIPCVISLEKIFAVLNTLLKPRHLAKERKVRKLKSHRLLSSKKSFHESWLAAVSKEWGGEQNEQSATTTSANTLRPAQLRP